MRNDLDKLKSLGAKAEVPHKYAPSVLEAFENRNKKHDYWVTFTAPEFTTLCPKTGQPDFATITVRYVPGDRLVESKSLKLYFFSFRKSRTRKQYAVECTDRCSGNPCYLMNKAGLLKPSPDADLKCTFSPSSGKDKAVLPFFNMGKSLFRDRHV